MSGIVERYSDKSGGHHKYRVHVNSDYAVDAVKGTPHSYTVNLPGTLPHVRKVTLTNYRVPVSNIHLVIRTSIWHGAATTDYDDIHDQALTLEPLFNAGSNFAATITSTNTALDVHRVFAWTETRGGDGGDAADFKTYSAFVCTGTLGSSTGISDLSLTYENTTTDFDTTGSPIAPVGSAGTAAVSTSTTHQFPYLFVKVGSHPCSRLDGPGIKVKRWESFHYYPEGAQVLRSTPYATSGPMDLYVCKRSHVSVLFDRDFTTRGYWTNLTAASDTRTTAGGGATPAATYTDSDGRVFREALVGASASAPAPVAWEGAFHVVGWAGGDETFATHDSKSGVAEYEVRADDVRSISVGWRNETGPYLFPKTNAIDFLDYTASGDSQSDTTAKAQTHTLTLELDYYTGQAVPE